MSRPNPRVRDRRQGTGKLFATGTRGKPKPAEDIKLLKTIRTRTMYSDSTYNITHFTVN